MTFDSGTLNSVEESGEANLGFTHDAMRTRCSPFHAFRRRDAGSLTVRAAVTIVGRRVGLNYLRIREKRLDSTQSVN